MKDLIIIGAGPAGLTAAVYARRAGIAAVVFEGGMYGGQVGNTPRIDNYPSYQSVEGWELAQKMYKQAEAAGAEFVYETVTGINTDGAAITVTAGKSEYSAQAVIIANGSKRRRIGCAGEERLSGRGVSWCHLRRSAVQGQRGGGCRRRKHRIRGRAVPHGALQ